MEHTNHARNGERSAVRRLAVARLASTGGSQAAQIALAYSIYERTDSAAWVSASLVASAGIVGLFGPLSGWLSDRCDRRRLMVVAEIGGALGWLAVLLVDSPLLWVVGALVATAANAPFRAASSASIPNLVAADDLSWANGILATASNTSVVVGPLIGGALVGVTGPRVVFALNVISFLLSAALVARIRGTFAEHHTDGAAARRTSWVSIMSDRRRRLLYGVTAASFAAFGVTLVADLPLIDRLGGGSLGYALLTTLWGVGAVLGSRLAGRVSEKNESSALVYGTGAMAASIGSIVFMPNLPSVILVGTLGGLGSGVAFTPWFSLLQRATQDSQRGTAFAIAETFEQISFVGGMVAAGLVLGLLDPQTVYVVPGVLLLVATAVAWSFRTGERARTRHEELADVMA